MAAITMKMTMSRSEKKTEFSTRLRLPPLLENYIRNRADMMGQSINEVVKYAIISMMQSDRFDTVHGSSTVPKPELKLLPVDAEVDRFDTVDGTANGNPPRTPYNSNIYSIKKDILYITDIRLENAWKEFEQHRKEIRKKLKPTQIKHMWKRFEKIINDHGVDGLIECINQTITNGWTGVFSTHLDEAKKIQKGGEATFSEEDF